MKRKTMISFFVVVAAGALSSAGASSVLGAGQPVVSFRLMNWREAHFKDASTAKRHFDTVRQLGCEAIQDSHDGHHDVIFRAPKWRSIRRQADREAHQWAHWLGDNGFETVFMQPTSGGHLATVAFRLQDWKSGHLDNAAQADGLADTLRMLACEVKQESHGGHHDVSYRSTQWRMIGLESHEAAHNWERWLKASGFETKHEHSTAQDTGAPTRRR